MKKHYRQENDCLNCGTRLEGKFCYHCGQENLEIKESFGHMMNHAISDYFHFDHQFFHTLKPLFLKPGMLTNEYMAGKRVQFLHPVKMYIFISLVYFVMVFHEQDNVMKVEQKKITSEHVKDSILNVIDSGRAMLPQQKARAMDQIKIRAGQHFKEQVAKIKPVNTKTYNTFNFSGTKTYNDTSYAQYLSAQQKLPPAQRDGWIRRYISQKTFVFKAGKVEKIKLINETIQHNFPKIMFLLLPLFALILRIAFFKNRKFYVEHLIYAFHLHCFMFLFLTFVMVIQFVMPAAWHSVNEWLMLFATIVIFWYLYRSLRVVYQRSRWRTVSKMIGVTVTYTIAFTICLLFFIALVTVAVV